MLLVHLRKVATRCHHASTRVPYQLVLILLFVFAVTLYTSFGVRLVLYTQYDPAPLDPIGRWGTLPESYFNLTSTHRPDWLDPPPSSDKILQPLRLRIAVISHPSEYERRKAFRQYILSNLPAREIHIDYRFVMGHSKAAHEVKVAQEQMQHRDILLLDMVDNQKRMGEKRWRMFLWGAEEEAGKYDYFMNVDTDAFVRFTALARRLRDREATHPGDRSILWGSIGSHSVHFLPSEDESHPEQEDVQLPEWHRDKFWYSFPYGYAFLMSSALVARLSKPGLVLPHHVNYPADDVLVGNWIADWAREGTEFVDDKEGIHDAPAHSYHRDRQREVGWESVVVHKVGVREMRGLRYREEFMGEWEGM